jgi:hypothetical protein
MNGRLKQFAASFVVVLSLFVSSVSACACSHHQQVETVSSSCHGHSHSTKAETHQHTTSLETAQALVSETECYCIQPAPRVFAKSENVKIEKQVSNLAQISPVEIVFVPQTTSVKSEFITPFYLTDSFYNLTPGRAPPRL